MPLESTFSVSPYFDDFDVDKEFYKILFKPGVAVQTRELNQLQTIVQEQIERFGNHVFKSGTIVSGVNFAYNPSYNYVKILDAQTDTAPVAPSSYLNLYVKTSLNLTARVINYKEGFESNDPNLSTLYLQYMRSSDADSNGDIFSAFRSGDELTVYDIDNTLFSITINNGGTGFIRNDSVVIQSAITLSDVIGTFSAGETITQSGTGARATVISVGTYDGNVMLKIKPVEADLLDSAKDAGAWTIYDTYRVVGGTSGAQGIVSSSIGAGAAASLTVDSLGVVDGIVITAQGAGYDVLPHVTVKTANSSATVSTLSLSPLNYKAKVTVASTANSVGTGYAFSVTEGVIFQKGYFVKVDPQTIVIDKYSSIPDAVAVGFKTEEQVIDVNSDTTLYDNASNTTNFAAPGADRLKLNAVLETKTVAEAASNNEFFVLAEWSEGAPYRENRTTVYSTLGDEFARRTSETSGDFVLDPFIVQSKDVDLTSNTVNTASFSLIVDPGTGYINGNRVETKRNAYIVTDKAQETLSRDNISITARYGNYVVVDELVGSFGFASGAQVSLRDTAGNYITNANADTTIDLSGSSEIGTARVRSLVHNQGRLGHRYAQYNMYLFDIQMNDGKAFRDVKSIAYGVTAIADPVLEVDPSTGASIAVLKDTNLNTSMFRTGIKALKQISQVRYTYRTQAVQEISQASASIVVGPLATGFAFTSSGSLSTDQRRDILIVPINETKSTANISGNATFTTGSKTITGVGTSFLSEVEPGDWLYVDNSSSNTRVQVESVVNDTTLTLFALPGAAVTSANMATLFPALHPINLEDRTVTVTSNASGAFMTVELGRAGIDDALVLDASPNARIDYNINTTNSSPKPKTVKRDLWVKFHTSNNAGGATGPWSLGVCDVLRLKGAWVSASSTVDTATDTEITRDCYIDLNTTTNLHNPARLVLETPNASVNNNVYIHVKFDAFESSGGGFFNLQSYNIDDTLSLSDSAATINTLEIPEFATESAYYDLRDTFDFRIVSSDNATITSNNQAATLNPASTTTIPSDPKLLPVPDSTITFDAEYYLPRDDRVFVNRDGSLDVIRGGGIDVFAQRSQDVKSAILASPNPGAMELARVRINQYPSIPRVKGGATLEFLNKYIGIGSVLDKKLRAQNFNVSIDVSKSVRAQPRRYTMRDINALATRLEQVEQLSSLTRLEMAIRDKSIPSENDATLERFKYGYFVESFDGFGLGDTTNKEYQITVEPVNSRARPMTKVFNFKLLYDRNDSTTRSSIIDEKTLMLPYVEEALITQNLKTSIVNPDGQRIQFIGEGTVDPYSFDIQARVDVIYTKIPPPKPAKASTGSVGGTSAVFAGGDGGGDGGNGGWSSSIDGVSLGGQTNSGFAGDPGGDGGGEGGGDCFTADTAVSMADGTTKQIADVQIGDKVLARDGVTVNTVRFVEIVSNSFWDTLYTPTNKYRPFATLNHPLYVDNKLTTYSDVSKVSWLYPWLDIEHEATPVESTPLGSQTVYNLWVDNDGTYIVNGYGTTSIVGDGGWLALAGNRGWFTQDQLQEFFVAAAKRSSLTRYGCHVTNNSGIDNSMINMVLRNAVNHNGICRQALFAFGFVAGTVAKATKFLRS